MSSATPIRFHRHLAELVRAGPAHNQLLSPLVPYLALCDDQPARTVHLPWEHRDWLARLRALRYEECGVRDDQLSGRRRALADLRAVVTSLVDIPSMVGAVGTGERWTHLRLVLTPDELAALPFELMGPPGTAEADGFSIQVDPARPTVITREVRLGTAAPPPWSEVRQPRVLFAAAQLAGWDVPFRAHLLALDQALSQWYPPVRAGERLAPDRAAILTVLPGASRQQIEDECAKTDFTHVHILAHGARTGEGDGAEFGLRLHGDRGGDEVVDAERLASSLCVTRQDGTRSAPRVVTLASCESGTRGTMLVPGASLAQRVHAAGVSLVVGSQFPLTKAGSVRLIEVLYRGLLAGDHPLVTLARARQTLFRESGDAHDWASMVVYARFPGNLDEVVQIGRLRSMFPLMELGNKWLDEAVDLRSEQVDCSSVIEKEIRRLEKLLDTLETLKSEAGLGGGAYDEAWGLAGSVCKRIAGAWHNLGDGNKSLAALRRAEENYRGGMEARPGDHWNAVQSILLRQLMEGSVSDEEKRHLAVARTCAEHDKSRQDWGLTSLVELDLMEGAGTDVVAKRFREIRNPTSRRLTLRQLRRYVDWWAKVPTLPGAAPLAPIAKDVLARVDRSPLTAPPKPDAP